jgi:hypothetical protein
VRGEQGERGLMGPAAQHEWDGRRVRFSRGLNAWGDYVDLGAMPGVALQRVQLVPQNGQVNGTVSNLVDDLQNGRLEFRITSRTSASVTYDMGAVFKATPSSFNLSMYSRGRYLNYNCEVHVSNSLEGNWQVLDSARATSTTPISQRDGNRSFAFTSRPFRYLRFSSRETTGQIYRRTLVTL